jgi:hypothetical protein
VREDPTECLRHGSDTLRIRDGIWPRSLLSRDSNEHKNTCEYRKQSRRRGRSGDRRTCIDTQAGSLVVGTATLTAVRLSKMEASHRCPSLRERPREGALRRVVVEGVAGPWPDEFDSAGRIHAGYFGAKGRRHSQGEKEECNLKSSHAHAPLVSTRCATRALAGIMS